VQSFLIKNNTPTTKKQHKVFQYVFLQSNTQQMGILQLEKGDQELSMFCDFKFLVFFSVLSHDDDVMGKFGL